MSTNNKLATLERSIAQLRRKGVTGIKVELEANLRRGGGDYDDDYESCDHCDEGRIDCGECSYDNNRDMTVVTCPDCGNDPDNGRADCETCEGNGEVGCDYCDGYGRIDCEECDGNGRTQAYDTNWRSTVVCKDWLLDRVATLTNTVRTGDNRDNQEENNPFSWMTYAQFYYDGSVDSEITFTVPNTLEAVQRIPDVIRAFRDLGDEIGNGIDVRGAGMHLALLFSEDCSYPDRAADYSQDRLNSIRASLWNADDFPEVSTRISDQKLKNFKRSMTQLLPALYFLGSPNETSRGLRYRMPSVSIHEDDAEYGNAKYNAITYRLGAFEFRVFETCYDNPEAALDNIVVMANSMRYLSQRYISPGLDKKIKSMRFGSDSDNTVARLYKTSEHLDALNLGLQRLKPDYYTVRELKQMRKFKHNKHRIGSEHKRTVSLAERAYEEYSQRFDFAQQLDIVAQANQRVASRVQSMSLEDMQTFNLAEAVEQAQAEIASNYSPKQEKTTYVSNVIENNTRNNRGEYSLYFA